MADKNKETNKEVKKEEVLPFTNLRGSCTGAPQTKKK